ncbi:ABC transporter permease [Fuscibacter oryzae]|uniref:ABC transporter permease n=1 Tax=Fuscibacter oryzae TaxID=2803939 RepID=A0A8J7MQL3_9RHOB|nr:ABC transporter permease [Fuscibacter oryzae]MBL4929415.1 ABC transporter permease [Fuscibacter oryzae]
MAPAAGVLVFLFLIPTLILLVFSFWLSKSFVLIPAFTGENYMRALQSSGFIAVMLNSLKIGLITATVSVILSYPMAVFIVFKTRTNLFMYLVLASWFTSYLVRIYGWRMILGSNGLINSSLLAAGLIDQPLDFLLYNAVAVVVAMTHVYIPITLLMLVSALRDVSPDYIAAAKDLGAGPMQTFLGVTLPMINRGLISSFMFTCILAAGDYITPQLLGGRTGTTVGLLISNQFRQSGNWPFGASMAFISFVVFVALYFAVVVGFRVARLAPYRRYH